jgi:excisionase family DNA binding protein
LGDFLVFTLLTLIHKDPNVFVSNHKFMATNTPLNLSDLPDLLTVREVAQVLRVSMLTIKRWGKRGKLPAIRINSRGDRRYKKEAVLWLLGMQAKTS